MRINKIVVIVIGLSSACGEEEHEWQGPPPRPALFNKECGSARLRPGEWCSEWHRGVEASCSGGLTSDMCCTKQHGCYLR